MGDGVSEDLFLVSAESCEPFAAGELFFALFSSFTWSFDASSELDERAFRRAGKVEKFKEGPEDTGGQETCLHKFEEV